MQGEWTAKLIDNPDYQGEWVHPHIPNPDYEQDEFLYRYEDFGVIGFDLWQVRKGGCMDRDALFFQCLVVLLYYLC